VTAPPAGVAGLACRPLRAGDFARAREVVDDWFGHPVGLVMHRLFFDQLGPSGVWMEEGPDGPAAGFLLGLVSEAEPDLAYVHMHVVAPRWRGTGAAERLYAEFCARARARGCGRVRALAAPGRAASRRFHERLGFTAVLAPAHLGPGEDRLVYERTLPLPVAPGAPLASPRSGSRGTVGGEMAEGTAHDDRRAHPRADVALPARVVAGDAVVDARSVNLSEGGVLLAGADFPSAAQVRIEIELAEMGWHALDAEVVRSDARPGGTLAARFAEAATEGGREAIRAFFAARLREPGGDLQA
jgi:GNAT superfamily N-acetyltransferase